MLEYKRETTQGGLGLEVTCHAMKVRRGGGSVISVREQGSDSMMLTAGVPG
jgi:hypothetical protein